MDPYRAGAVAPGARLSVCSKMSVEFSKPLADAKDFPTPLFDFNPKPAPGTKQLRREMLPHRKDYPDAAVFLRARYGLACVAKALLKEGAKVLLPAYHCPAMIEPFVWAGCSLSFYDVNPTSLSPAESTRELFMAADAILLSHFCYPRRELRLFSDEARAAGLLVIEDLAHAALQEVLIGDVGVTSLAKFLPVPFGGEVLSANSDVATSVAREHRNLQVSSMRWTLGSAGRRIKQRFMKKSDGGNFRYFDPHTMTRPMQAPGSRTLPADETARHATMRRKNFSALNEFFSDRYPGHRIDPDDIDNGAPYAFPLLLPNEGVFADLKQQGAPLQRWEEIAPSPYSSMETLRRRLVQLPVHQQLSPRNIGSLINVLDTVLKRAN